MDSELENFTIPGSNYGYTGAKIEDLTSFKNTLAVGLIDESGSTMPYAKAMEKAIKEIIKSLRHSPSADNLIYGHYHFATDFREIHGFKPLAQCNEGDYENIWGNGGTTCLYDSCNKVIQFVGDYGKKQNEQRYSCNGIIYVITDGCDYGSSLNPANVRKSLEKTIAEENLESLMTILIGINDNNSVQKKLQQFQADAGFTQYIPVEKADEKSLARIANFISKSVSSQSQALGSGLSQSLVF